MFEKYRAAKEARLQEDFNKRIVTFFNVPTANIAISSPNEQFREAENKVWYLSQDSAPLMKFYSTRMLIGEYRTNSFYQINTHGDIAYYHYNLPQMITKAMSNLLFSKLPSSDISSGNQAIDKKLNILIHNILIDNNYSSLLKKAAEYASYSGQVGFKLVLDSDVSSYPIIQVYPKENIEVITKYDRTVAIIFKDYYPKDDNGLSSYVLYSIYKPGSIEYKLYSESFTVTNQDANREEVPLSTLSYTAGLKPIYFYYRDGTPADIIMADVIDNKTNGVSDYTGIIDDCIALDEIYSNRQTFIRDSIPRLYVPSMYSNKDVNTGITNVSPGVDYATHLVPIPTGNPNWNNIELKRDIVDIKANIEGYNEAMIDTIKRAINTSGLSPATIGLDDAGSNSSAEALNIRERVSMRTREEKIQLWSEGLSHLYGLLLAMVSAEDIKDNEFIIDDTRDINITITFPNYERDIANEQAELNLIKDKLNANLITERDALQLLYPDYDDKEIDAKILELSSPKNVSNKQ